MVSFPMGRPPKHSPEIIEALVSGMTSAQAAAKFGIHRNTATNYRNRLVDGKIAVRNPLCACGCGHEVARPWSKYIFGHSSAGKLSDEDVLLIRLLLKRFVSHSVIAALVGCSAKTVASIKANPDRKPPKKARNVVRLHDIITKSKEKERNELKCLRQGKRTMKELKHLLKHPEALRLRQKESRQGTTSPIS